MCEFKLNVCQPSIIYDECDSNTALYQSLLETIKA